MSKEKTEKMNLMLRLPPELDKKLTDRAKKEYRSKASVLRQLIAEF